MVCKTPCATPCATPVSPVLHPVSPSAGNVGFAQWHTLCNTNCHTPRCTLCYTPRYTLCHTPRYTLCHTASFAHAPPTPPPPDRVWQVCVCDAEAVAGVGPDSLNQRGGGSTEQVQSRNKSGLDQGDGGGRVEVEGEVHLAGVSGARQV